MSSTQATTSGRKTRRSWRPRFLDALRATGIYSRAARDAGVSRRTVYKARETDEAFAAACAAAIEDACDLLEEEARRRAYEGTERPVFYQGKECGRIREYSDTLLTFLLRAARPAKFRERSESWAIDPSTLSDEQLARIAAGEHPAVVLSSTGR